MVRERAMGVGFEQEVGTQSRSERNHRRAINLVF